MFDLAVSRTEEITLGIVCASIVGSVLFPSQLAPTIIERTDAWFRDAAFYSTETLSGRIAGAAISGARQRLAATINGLELLLSQLAYDHTRPDLLTRAHELRGRMQLLLPLMSALADPLIALYNSGSHKWPQGLEALLADIVKWFNAPLPAASAGYHPDPAANALRERIAAMQPAPAALTTWEGALLSSALWRMKQVIDVWQDCRSLRIIITREEGFWRPRFRHWRLGGTERFYDRGMMLFSTGSTAAAVILACSLWIGSGWADGASAVTLAAVACCFFAALDEPAPMVFRFFVATAISVVAAGVYLFAVLPHVHDFPMLVILFAAPFILVGTLIPRPQFNMVTVLVAVNTATFISIQDAYDANFLTFLNSNLAGIAGLLYAYMWTRVTRPFGAELAAARLLRSSWSDVALTASTRPIEDPRNHAARMLDRLMQLIPRLGATDDHRHPSIESFRDLRIAFNSIDLRRLTRKLGGEAPAAIEQVLEGVRAYYESCVNRRTREPVPRSLMPSIDSAVARVTAQGLANADAPSATSQTSARHLRDALHALIGLRLSLFPATLQAVAPPPRGAGA
ncbi:MAG: Tetrapartite efflux system, inner membrane component FusBC-like [uncultured Paraburkholderia sp.]|nr:MAG: Tetrapartite efflux system, inner membrane component FusBC-like [uncultured Paraburkholderia sp.]